MFKLSEIKELIKLVDQTSVHELEIEMEGTRVSIRKPGKTEVVSYQQSIPQAYPTAPLHVQPMMHSTDQGTGLSVTDQSTSADLSSTLHKIVSPMVGTFYRSASPDDAPFVSSGDKVDLKSTVCIIEAMKLMNELEAEIKGQIVEVLVENGQLVEYGQPLFLVKTE
ncbi:acetyl-CoA carboxylase, biotin carboxyl carrier protein [Paenibacillus macquariensis subsp. defensor]|uniref:Biotin carboxyl carrier protein of acetyl-CoA carboxylase n=1 Tax=Paenibacillus macquariensis TaxID=948756 RepID=A0ABY1JKK5_9BACL|nr:acetyl-CoA carboxylase biotin carboxyl carrier protein [Paenibacillus macquariensis]MEC0089951.1 acetyl-CoA carboxylase biotin carboxyl carrier protein [Paenibacillus macquariensis]OAB31160.1 acetyl-CoA carboxylase, biotin carboxyl carrier protein [Paenibacillus macquariensis subsp. macquariensis]OAB32732.1 acetyl-CoA carboxylase, biotin carboxyl carrier protein [Paenibacillus macquariensis subsp. defensor]SIQ34903.1 biotin carboxyl carrier protein [Paenibacillus macquariensis]